jgi:NTP pyrophosphatase (non-canonical NTP hydrolase)
MDQKRDTSTIKALQESLAHHERDLRIEFRTLTKKEKDILMKTVKLQEEVGELANEILAVLALQRKSKLAKFQMANLYAEFSDVVIASASLANTLGVDLDRAISKKMETLITEYSKDR